MSHVYILPSEQSILSCDKSSRSSSDLVLAVQERSYLMRDTKRHNSANVGLLPHVSKATHRLGWQKSPDFEQVSA